MTKYVRNVKNILMEFITYLDEIVSTLKIYDKLKHSF